MTTQFRLRYERLGRMVDLRLAALVRGKEPRDVKDACRHVLAGGGKRVRPAVTMLACEAAGGSTGDALDAGAAIELLHNFTLVHDDIMDHATSRRGKPTVHVRWDVNTALLSGDILLGLGFRSLLKTRSEAIRDVTDVFTEGLIAVCEGQALDLAYERRKDVTIPEYFRMIEKKTAALLAAAAEIGAMLGGATSRRRTALRTALRRFGFHLGRAFQLQDDLLDVVADQRRLGKPVGGDILEGKRTFLLLRAAQRARGADAAVIQKILAQPGGAARRLAGADRRRLVERVSAIYAHWGVLDEAASLVRRDTAAALRALSALPAGDATAMLRWLAEQLVHRAS
jgi:geranylgeranyl diphosphate synthase type II